MPSRIKRPARAVGSATAWDMALSPWDVPSTAIVAQRFRGYIGKKACELVGRNPEFYVRLNQPGGTPDEVAKLVWMLIDGNTKVGEIQSVLEKRFPGKDLDIMQLAIFLRILENNPWIVYRR